MGWFWTSSSAGAGSASASPADAAASNRASTPLPSSSTTSTTANNATDSLVDGDPELRKFLALFQEANTASEGPRHSATPVSSSSSSTTTSPTSTSTLSLSSSPPAARSSFWSTYWPSSSLLSSSSSSSSSSTAQRAAVTDPAASSSTAAAPGTQPADVRERSLAEAVLPTSMSCRQAFDLAWGCQSPVGQWRSVFRHGTVSPCSELWDDFWFCMRIRGMTTRDPQNPLAQEAVRTHYREKELRKYYAPDRPSSEDVWRARSVDEILPPGAVFGQPFFVAAPDQGSRDGELNQSGRTE